MAAAVGHGRAGVCCMAMPHCCWADDPGNFLGRLVVDDTEREIVVIKLRNLGDRMEDVARETRNVARRILEKDAPPLVKLGQGDQERVITEDDVNGQAGD